MTTFFTQCSTNRVMQMVLTVILAVVVSLIFSCSSSSKPTSPASLSLSISQNVISENSPDSVVVTASLSKTLSDIVVITLELGGSAQVDIDYEVSSLRVRFPVGTQSETIEIRPIRDWNDDPNEFVTVHINTITGNATDLAKTSVSLEIGDEPVPGNYKEDLQSSLRVFSSFDVYASRVNVTALAYNYGYERAPEVNLSIELFEDLENSASSVYYNSTRIPSLTARGSYRRTFNIYLDTLDPNNSYYGKISWWPTSGAVSSELSSGSDYFSFATDADSRVVVDCEPNNEIARPFETDILQEEQWHLMNDGQSAFANTGGTPGADLGMEQILSTGPEGESVVVAVVDTGLEICHPDLVDNVEENASFNFAADESDDSAVRGTLYDPYNPNISGDHGTSVAGIVSATALNGIGGRGVAPKSLLRGFNYLENQSFDVAISLGFSDSDPVSSDVDIFNMSYGTSGYQGFGDAALYQSGITSLRSGKGAIYVKSAGNGFYGCHSITHDIRGEIGCNPANADPTNNLPYLIVVAGFNADDERASYSSIGSNVWISAPAGEFGRSRPAIITTDQQGLDKGYDSWIKVGLAENHVYNSFGNYVSTFNGTSSAAPMTAGAVAVLLSANPELTWRDVKHILAKTARKIHRDIVPVRIAFGGGVPYTMRQPWIENAAGFNFHNWYGFGAIDLDEALAMAESYTADSLGDFEESEVYSHDVRLDVIDFDSSGVTSSIVVNDLPFAASIEAVEVDINGFHWFLPDISITLESPDGTKSVILPLFTDFLIHDQSISWRLLSNAFYGESPLGEWVLKVVDAAREHDGWLDSWSLKIYYGDHPDN
ncbi:MAG: S8 family serine peptidase [Gammaproteobacteria bacterium]|nr:S8 family serine peptidase [Gammaproteobacteria bacterium]MYF52362.1 S8 family serine peptidase [Gammaproteobacteria bacterium]MYK43950.1 S8 family serine peptidase [Gammaproteobacteria bacterium]